MMIKVVVLLFLASCFCYKVKKTNLRPIIGVLSQKVGPHISPNIANSKVYIAASYVKYLEMAGAQVVPVLTTYSKKKIRRLLRYINGVLLPGGAAPLQDSAYYRVARIVFEEAKKLNDDGVHFPVWGTCLGFEALHVLASSKKVLLPVHAENISMELNITLHAFDSRLFLDMPKKLMQTLMFEKVTLNMHSQGISPNTYITDKKLNTMYRVLSTNHDTTGTEFVSTIEGIHYPIYGTQWHPEKNLFEWTRKEQINHSSGAIQVTQYMANFFVDEARKNFQTFPNISEELKYIIYQWAPVFSGSTSLFDQVYVFGNSTEHKAI